MNRKVGTAKKEDIDKILGNPAKCQSELVINKCEYRTAAGRNLPTPAVFSQQKTMGPDVSPYEYFDVLLLLYDENRVLKEWEPLVIYP